LRRTGFENLTEEGQPWEEEARMAYACVLDRKGQSVADMANGPFQRTQPFPETIALLKKLGVGLLSKCVSC